MQFIFIVFIPPFSNTSQIHPTPYLPNFSVSLSLFFDSIEFYGHSIKPTPDNLSLYT